MFNLRKIMALSILLSAFTVLLLLPFFIVEATGPGIDKSELSNGIISVNYKPETDSKIKVMVGKGDTKCVYDYGLDPDSVNRFPLQFGDGEYTVSIFENVEGNKYRLLAEEKISLELENERSIYTQSIQMINWNEEMDSVKLARELTKDAENDVEKLFILYKYVINNITYDYDKANSLGVCYIPFAEETLYKRQGVCYDYVNLFATMLRGINIPTKLVMGYKNDINVYHAWNQIYLEDFDKWIIIDTAYDAAMYQNNYPVTMIKDDEEYFLDRYY